jgi:hypothetical protein
MRHVPHIAAPQVIASMIGAQVKRSGATAD